MSKVFVQFFISAVQAFTFVVVGNGITEIKGMWFQYWLVLFSCWASANMLGLVISDSFKAVVTIYILIPFLVIPQIILSGIMVKYEKLNPDFSSPVSIPVYGEVITARWGYEALAVEQFVNNKYERQFYNYDKNASQAQYYKDYWCSELIAKLDNLENNLTRKERDPGFKTDLILIGNEITKQLKILPDSITSNFIGYYTPDKITTDIIKVTKNYAERVKRYYVSRWKQASTAKDNLKVKLLSQDKDGFQKLKDDYSNDKIEEFVTDKNETTKIIEYRGEFVQKLNPIFMDPDSKFLRAHFYAPRKQIFGLFVDTFIVNVIVLWIMTGLLYLALYFRVLKKLLDSGELIMGKKGLD
jgi:ABC transport system ATP-binding/permease protein